jgi:hypothetical protein
MDQFGSPYGKLLPRAPTQGKSATQRAPGSTSIIPRIAVAKLQEHAEIRYLKNEQKNRACGMSVTSPLDSLVCQSMLFA